MRRDVLDLKIKAIELTLKTMRGKIADGHDYKGMELSYAGKLNYEIDELILYSVKGKYHISTVNQEDLDKLNILGATIHRFVSSIVNDLFKFELISEPMIRGKLHKDFRQDTNFDAYIWYSDRSKVLNKLLTIYKNGGVIPEKKINLERMPLF